MPLTQLTRADICTPKNHTPEAAAPPLPDLLASTDVGCVCFWLTAWARSLAAHHALVTHMENPTVWLARRKNLALNLALTIACFNAKSEIRESIKALKDVGGLLFAFVGTTKLQQVAA